MDPLPAERILAKIFRTVFSPYMLSSYIFLFCSYMILACRIYFILYPQLFLVLLLSQIVATALIPYVYTRYISASSNTKQRRDVLAFALVVSIINFLLLKNFVPQTLFTPIATSFVITFTTIILLLIQSYFTQIDLHCTVIGVIVGFALLMPYYKTFLSLSIVLLVSGLALSVYIVCGKSNLKQIVYCLITGFLSVGISLLL